MSSQSKLLRLALLVLLLLQTAGYGRDTPPKQVEDSTQPEPGKKVAQINQQQTPAKRANPLAQPNAIDKPGKPTSPTPSDPTPKPPVLQPTPEPKPVEAGENAPTFGSEETLVTVEKGDPELEQAMAQAKTTLDQFIARLENPQPMDSNFAIKVPITDENGRELFWATRVKKTEKGFVATIDNEPGIVKSVSFGQEITVARDEIHDWMFMSKGVMQGNYTLRVLISTLPPEEAASLKKQIGWD